MIIIIITTITTNIISITLLLHGVQTTHKLNRSVPSEDFVLYCCSLINLIKREEVVGVNVCEDNKLHLLFIEGVNHCNESAHLIPLL